jgi:hypothetical protein
LPVKDSYPEKFLTLLPCTSVLQHELIHLSLTFSLVPDHLPILTSVTLSLDTSPSLLKDDLLKISLLFNPAWAVG